MLNILYYIPTWVELNDPLFRYGTYKGILAPEIRGLLDSNPDITIGVVLSESIYDEAEKSKILDKRVKYFVPGKSSQLNSIPNSTGNSLIHESLLVSEFLKIVDGFIPDLVLSYENQSRWLKNIFGGAIVLDVMFGAFSRAPYPVLASYDPSGLFGNSFLSKFEKKIRNYCRTSQENNILKVIRRNALQGISEYQVYKRKLSELKQRFNKLVLVACQVDDYFAVTENSKYQCQYDMVIDICNKVDKSIGVIVTQHSYREAISETQVKYIESKFENVIFFDTSGIMDASQYIVPYIDCVATIGSSLAFQAALWQIPVVAMGNTHINLVSSGFDPKDINSLILALDENEREEIENALAFVLFRYNKIYRSDIFNGVEYYEFLKEIAISLTNDPTGETFYFDSDLCLDKIESNYNSASTAYQLRGRNVGIEKDYLLFEIARYKVASYDLFDTLLQRPILYPHELFLLIEPKVRALLNNRNFPYHVLRRNAENDVRRPTLGRYEVTIHDIYRRFSELSGISDEQSEIIKNIELDAELELCSIKPYMTMYYRYSRLLCDVVGIVSDFYIEQGFIKSLLEKNDIKYDFLYVSATEVLRKNNGTIYKRIISDLTAKGYAVKDIIHIGDNRVADKEMAEANGIKGYLFPRAVDNFSASSFGKNFSSGLRNSGLSSSIVLGLISNRFYGTPWNQIDSDSSFRGDPHMLGYAGFGPLIVGFCQWLNREKISTGASHMFFLARDGYVVKQVYEELYGSSDKNVYLYSSRRAASVAAIRTVDDIVELAYQSFNPQPLSTFLFNRLGFNLTSKHEIILQKCKLRADTVIHPHVDMNRVTMLLHEISGEIFEIAQSERENYLMYLDQVGYTDKSKSNKALLIDIGYSGTMQYYLSKLVDGVEVMGRYLLTHHHSKDTFDNANFKGYLAHLDDHRISYRHELNNHVFIFEAGLSSLEGSLLRFEKTGDNTIKPVLLDAEEEENRRIILMKIHQGIRDFAFDYKNALGHAFDVVHLSPLLAQKSIIDFSNSPKPKDAEIFLNYEVENLFGGGSVSLIDKFNNSSKLSENMLEMLIGASKWKQGAKSYYMPLINKRADSNVNYEFNKEKFKKGPGKHRQYRKKTKLANKPYLFFSDSKKPYLRWMRYLFINNQFGNLNHKIVKLILG